LLVSSTGSGDGGVQYNASNNIMSLFAYAGMRFHVGTSNISGGYPANEAYRITAARDMYFGQTSGSAADAGHIMQANGVMFHTANGTAPLYLRRNTSNGAVISISAAGADVGSIGSSGGDLVIGNGDVGLYFYDGADAILPWNNSTGGVSDNAIALGVGSFRFSQFFAATGSINTSDRNEKQDIEELSDAEKRVAVAAKSLLRKYRWKSAVAEKGDDARIHFGIIAQDLQDAFTAEGLDAARYGMWCSDTWTDEDTGEERTRLGVRYSELLAFIISAI